MIAESSTDVNDVGAPGVARESARGEGRSSDESGRVPTTSAPTPDRRFPESYEAMATEPRPSSSRVRRVRRRRFPESPSDRPPRAALRAVGVRAVLRRRAGEQSVSFAASLRRRFEGRSCLIRKREASGHDVLMQEGVRRLLPVAASNLICVARSPWFRLAAGACIPSLTAWRRNATVVESVDDEARIPRMAKPSRPWRRAKRAFIP